MEITTFQQAVEHFYGSEEWKHYPQYEVYPQTISIKEYPGPEKGWVVKITTDDADNQFFVGTDGKVVLIGSNVKIPGYGSISFSGPPRDTYLFGGPRKQEE